jgi:hypothetical protein
MEKSKTKGRTMSRKVFGSADSLKGYGKHPANYLDFLGVPKRDDALRKVMKHHEPLPDNKEYTRRYQPFPMENPIAEEDKVFRVEPTPRRKAALMGAWLDLKINLYTKKRMIYENALALVAGNPAPYEMDLADSNKAVAVATDLHNVGNTPEFQKDLAETRASIKAFVVLKAQMESQKGDEEVAATYLMRFHQFLRGAPAPGDAARLKALGLDPKFQAFQGDEFKAYLESWTKLRAEYLLALTLMKMRGPGDTLKSAELYFKYLVDADDLDDISNKGVWHYLEFGRGDLPPEVIRELDASHWSYKGPPTTGRPGVEYIDVSNPGLTMPLTPGVTGYRSAIPKPYLGLRPKPVPKLPAKRTVGPPPPLVVLPSDIPPPAPAPVGDLLAPATLSDVIVDTTRPTAPPTVILPLEGAGPEAISEERREEMTPEQEIRETVDRDVLLEVPIDRDAYDQTHALTLDETRELEYENRINQIKDEITRRRRLVIEEEVPSREEEPSSAEPSPPSSAGLPFPLTPPMSPIPGSPPRSGPVPPVIEEPVTEPEEEEVPSQELTLTFDKSISEPSDYQSNLREVRQYVYGKKGPLDDSDFDTMARYMSNSAAKIREERGLAEDDDFADKANEYLLKSLLTKEQGEEITKRIKKIDEERRAAAAPPPTKVETPPEVRTSREIQAARMEIQKLEESILKKERIHKMQRSQKVLAERHESEFREKMKEIREGTDRMAAALAESVRKTREQDISKMSNDELNRSIGELSSRRREIERDRAELARMREESERQRLEAIAEEAKKRRDEKGKQKVRDIYKLRHPFNNFKGYRSLRKKGFIRHWRGSSKRREKRRKRKKKRRNTIEKLNMKKQANLHEKLTKSIKLSRS